MCVYLSNGKYVYAAENTNHKGSSNISLSLLQKKTKSNKKLSSKTDLSQEDAFLGRSLLFLLLLFRGLLLLGLFPLLRGLARLALLAPQRRAAVVLAVGDVVAVAVVGEEHLELLADQHHLLQGAVVIGYSWLMVNG